MKKILAPKNSWALALFILLDMVAAGMGMGVPFFCILFGLPVGWIIARRLLPGNLDTRQVLTRVLRQAALTSAFTVLIMAGVWASSFLMLFDPTADLANYGLPQILYEPLASFIGWLVLMIFISPFLQFLMTLFGAHLALTWGGSDHAHPA